MSLRVTSKVLSRVTGQAERCFGFETYRGTGLVYKGAELHRLHYHPSFYRKTISRMIVLGVYRLQTGLGQHQQGCPAEDSPALRVRIFCLISKVLLTSYSSGCT